MVKKPSPCKEDTQIFCVPLRDTDDIQDLFLRLFSNNAYQFSEESAIIEVSLLIIKDYVLLKYLLNGC